MAKKEKPVMVGCKMFGPHFKNGVRYSGWGIITLNNGKTVYVGEKDAYPDKMIDIAEEQGYDVSYYKTRLEDWVKTGS